MPWLLLALCLLLACERPTESRGRDGEVFGTTEPTVAEIRHWLKRTRSLELDTVLCPPSVPVEKGYAFECTATAKGASVPVIVEFVDDRGQLKMTLKYAVVVAAEVEKAIGAPQVDCGPRIRPAKVGKTFRCSVSGGQTPEVEVKIANKSGGVTWEYVAAATGTSKPSHPPRK
jgi:hypothetical protein